MPKRTVEDYKTELDDKIKSLLRTRNEKVVELNNLNKEIEVLMEQQLALDESKIKVKCIVCSGRGYIESEDGRKVMCQVCGGPDKPYIWAEKYTDTK